jgi:hypothetical protein
MVHFNQNTKKKKLKNKYRKGWCVDQKDKALKPTLYKKRPFYF